MAKRAKNKGKPIVIDASFDQLVKESVSGNPKPAPKEKSPTTEEFIKMLNSLPKADQSIIRYVLKLEGTIDPIKVPDKASLMIFFYKLIESARQEKKPEGNLRFRLNPVCKSAISKVTLQKSKPIRKTRQNDVF